VHIFREIPSLFSNVVLLRKHSHAPTVRVYNT